MHLQVGKEIWTTFFQLSERYMRLLTHAFRLLFNFVKAFILFIYEIAKIHKERTTIPAFSGIN